LESREKSPLTRHWWSCSRSGRRGCSPCRRCLQSY
jgi:hypothetical protein